MTVLAFPTSAAIAEGNPKMPLPRMLLSTSATMLQRPMARTSCGEALAERGSAVIARLYHTAAPVPTAARRLRTRKFRALYLRDPPGVQRHRGALRHRQPAGLVGGEEAAARAL